MSLELARQRAFDAIMRTEERLLSVRITNENIRIQKERVDALARAHFV